MIRRPPRSTRTDTLFPYTTLVRSAPLQAPEYPIANAIQPMRTAPATPAMPTRSEEHTSELQSLMRISYAVFCLKKKKNINHQLSQPPPRQQLTTRRHYPTSQPKQPTH